MGIGMEEQRIFEVLGIGETKDAEEIRKAYRNKLLSVNPEDNPEGFRRLREAYESALARCRREEDPEEEEDTPVSLYLKEVEAVYSSLSRRLDEEEWKRLAGHELLDDLEMEEEVKGDDQVDSPAGLEQKSQIDLEKELQNQEEEEHRK